MEAFKNHFRYKVKVLIISLLLMLFACSEKGESPKISPPYFVLNGTDSIAASTFLFIETTCKEYTISPKTTFVADNLYLAINEGDFFPFEVPIVLHDSINTISAYAKHSELERSTIASVRIHFKSSNFAATTLLYPHPAKETVLLEAENSYKGSITITIINAYGSIMDKLAVEKTNDLLEVRTDIADFPEGVYIFRIEYGDCEVLKKLVISRK